MAFDDNTMPTPAAAPAPPALDAPEVSTPAPASLDLSGLAQPAPSVTGTQEFQGYQSAVGNEAAAAKRAAELAAPTPAALPPPHARLLAMVQGLSLGLSAAGTAIATHGKGGGAQEVAQVQGEQQQQKLQAQQAALAQKNAQIQQQITIGDTNRTLAQSYLNLMTMPDEITANHLKVSGEQQRQIGAGQDIRTKALQDFQMTGDLGAYQKTLQQLDQSSGTLSGSGAAPTAPAPVAVTGWGNAIDTAKASYSNDPHIQAADEQFQAAQDLMKTDPQAASLQMASAARVAANRKAALDQTTESKTKQNALSASDPVEKLATPEALAQPGAQAAIQAKIADPTTKPEDLVRLRALLPQAAVAQFNAEAIKAKEARNQQALDQGDPEVAGQLLANRSLTLAELKARGAKPEYITAAITAAQKHDPTYKAAEAEAQAKLAASPANAGFFGNTDSLLVNGGTLDQLATAYKALGNTQIPAINKLNNLRKAAVGSGPLAAAYAAQLGVADDYSKVISGGGGSDSARQQALDIMATNLSPAGQDAAIAQIRKTIESQRNGRVGTNPYNKDMYPDPSTRQETPGLSGTQPATAPTAKTVVINPITKQAQTIGHKVGDIITQGGRNWTVTAVDSAGKVTGANPAGAQ